MAKKKQTIYSKDWASLHPYQGSARTDFYYTTIANKIYTVLNNLLENEISDENLFIWKKKKKSNWLVPLPHISKILFQKPVSSGHLLKNITGNTILPFRFFHATIMQMKRSTQRIYNF